MTTQPRPVRRFTVIAMAAMLTLGVGVVSPTGASAMPDESSAVAGFSTCRQLNADYPHGVSNRLKGRKWWVKRGATGVGLYCPRVYRQVKASLDRDRDNIACEH
jgi:Excalibur calcium-binding domain